MNAPRLLSLAAFSAALLATATVQAAPRPLLPTQSDITFTVKEMGVNVQGRFKRFTAQVELDLKKPEAATALVEVDIGSLDTGNADADEIALDKPWLDKLGFPKAIFRSTAVRALGGDRYEAKGQLSIRGKSRDVTVPMRAESLADGTVRITGNLTVLRGDFGIGGGEWDDPGLVANEIPVTFRLLLGAAK